MPSLYGIANCDSCRAARKWLADHAVDVQCIDVRETPPSVGQLNRWISAVGQETLINRRSRTWREIPPAEREDLNDRAAAALIARYPTVMKRPVLEFDGAILVGFDSERYSKHVVG